MNTSTYHKEGLRALALDVQSFFKSIPVTKLGLWFWIVQESFAIIKIFALKTK